MLHVLGDAPRVSAHGRGLVDAGLEQLGMAQHGRERTLDLVCDVPDQAALGAGDLLDLGERLLELGPEPARLGVIGLALDVQLRRRRCRYLDARVLLGPSGRSAARQIETRPELPEQRAGQEPRDVSENASSSLVRLSRRFHEL
jgi:hypothetical protein